MRAEALCNEMGLGRRKLLVEMATAFHVCIGRPLLAGGLETDSIRPSSAVRKRRLIAAITYAVTRGEEMLT